MKIPREDHSVHYNVENGSQFSSQTMMILLHKRIVFHIEIKDSSLSSCFCLSSIKHWPTAQNQWALPVVQSVVQWRRIVISEDIQHTSKEAVMSLAGVLLDIECNKYCKMLRLPESNSTMNMEDWIFIQTRILCSYSSKEDRRLSFHMNLHKCIGKHENSILSTTPFVVPIC